MSDRTSSCGAHGPVMEAANATFRATLPDDHLLATMMDEHSHILAKLDALEELARATQVGGPDPEQVKQVIAIADFLIGVEPHHQREERVLFPMLIERGLGGPPMVMASEHVELRALKQGIRNGAAAFAGGKTEDWDEICRTAESLVTMLRQHIQKENHVLYPMAAQVVLDAAVWEEARRRCDEIGYCCHHPAG